MAFMIAVPLGYIQGDVLAGGRIHRGLKLHISPQSCVGKVCVHLLGVLHDCYLIVIVARIRRLIWNGNRNVLSEVVFPGSSSGPAGVDEFPDAAGEGATIDAVAAAPVPVASEMVTTGAV